MGVRQKNAASPGHVRIELPARHPGQQRIHDDPARFKVVMCGRRYGKALALDTPIPTPTGWTTMGALAEGDWVLDEHGAPCRVTFATEVMEGRPCYRMTFSDGETVIADAEHRWLTWDRCARKNVARNTRVNARRAPVSHRCSASAMTAISYTHPRAHETGRNLVCRLLHEKQKDGSVNDQP